MIFRNLLKQMCTNKNDNAISISWNINDKLIDNINFCKDYDKIFSLKHFMLKYGYSLIEINNHLKYKDPFIKVKNDIKSAIDTNESMTLDEKNIKKNINFIKLLLIEDNKENHDLENAFAILINTIILELNISSGCDFYTRNLSEVNSYKQMLKKLSNNEMFFENDIYMCANIILKRLENSENFNNLFELYSKKDYFTTHNKYLHKFLNKEYLNGLIFKVIETALVHNENINYGTLFYKNDLSESNDLKINDCIFSIEKNNSKIFKNNFNKFKNDFNNLNVFIIESYNKYSNDLFNITINNDIVYDFNNYIIDYEPLTSGGKKKKYPIIIYFYSENVSCCYSYNNKSILDRMDITITKEDNKRIIIIKRIDNKLSIFEIKEHNINVDPFPKLVYKL